MVPNRNVELILEYEAGRKPYLSTSQSVMVGLALCEPALLSAAGYSNARDAWKRLDAEQVAAILSFNKHCL